MKRFEEVLLQFEPMISAAMWSLNIYRDHDQYRQAARIALWRAWSKYEEERGDFAPFAYMSIRGAILDELKRENRYEEREAPLEDEILNVLANEVTAAEDVWSDRIQIAISELSIAERQLLSWIFIESCSLKFCAERAGISVSGIKKRRERVMRKLKEKLQ
ncbi:sigma-70 family RNA polymerase sigma factor [Chungangia koreensis]|uniref:Sigma-70 family RNA polymerase sigma factor n=1 Tax=Chungangia koreensis TaxID=752657 RepID=A0ABV8X4J4_9LACT